MFSLASKRILITGASSGIGRQIAIDVAAMGATVILTGRDENRLIEVKSKLKGEGHELYSVDLTVKSQVLDFVNKNTSFDGVVFNAGIIEYGLVKFIKEENLDAIFNTNFKATVLLCQQLIKNKLVKKMGSILFISSISSQIGVSGTALYASSKAALSAYSRVLASELAVQKIRANCISPGIILTPMTSQASEVITDSSMKDAERAYPLGYGRPEDVSGLAVYLLSDASRWMTGSDLKLDGGLTLN